MTFSLSSPAFKADGPIPPRFACTGDGVSLPLDWTDPPAETQSFALIMIDPDAPGGTFTHWGVYNIPPDQRALAEDAAPPGDVTRNDGRTTGYFPPCPPPGHGVHHYHFRLMALDTPRLTFSAAPSVVDLTAQARPHILAEAELVGTFTR